MKLHILTKILLVSAITLLITEQAFTHMISSINKTPIDIDETLNQDIAFLTKDNTRINEVTNTSGKLELFSTDIPLVGDFEVKVLLKKMEKPGFLLLGFHRSSKIPDKKGKYFAVDDDEGWGISSNGFVCEYGKWSLLPQANLKQGMLIRFRRNNNVLSYSVDGEFVPYGYLMEAPLYLTANLKNKNDSIEIITDINQVK